MLYLARTLMKEKVKNEQIVDAAYLVQDDHNFNKGTEQGNRLLRESLEKYGAGRSMLIDKDNRIIAGNKTQQKAAELGMKVKIVETDANTIIAVKRTDVSLDSKEGREMALLDNLTTQVNLTWDKAELENISDSIEGFDVSDFGFDIDKMPSVSFVESNATTQVANVEEDDFDEEKDPVEAKVKLGEIWQMGKHRLMCGDSTKSSHIAKLMNGELADLWLTDPPYNVALGYKDSASEARQRHRRTDAKIVLNDSMPDEEFRQFLVSAYSSARDNMKNGAAYYIFHADNESYNFRGALRDVGGMQLRETLIWVKDTLTLGRQDYQWRHEPCLYGWKEGAKHKFYNDRKQTTCIEFPRPKCSEEHPTMKPVGLFAYLIANSTTEGEVVLDSFAGSGTTIVACEQLQRKGRCMELDPHYCDVIIARWEKMTGQKAVKVE